VKHLPFEGPRDRTPLELVARRGEPPASERLDLEGLVALLALADLELDVLALLERPVTVALDVGEVGRRRLRRPRGEMKP
jgi:hypothetical protein